MLGLDDPVDLVLPFLDALGFLVVVAQEIQGMSRDGIQPVGVGILDDGVVVDREQTYVVEPRVGWLVLDVADGVRQSL